MRQIVMKDWEVAVNGRGQYWRVLKFVSSYLMISWHGNTLYYWPIWWESTSRMWTRFTEGPVMRDIVFCYVSLGILLNKPWVADNFGCSWRQCDVIVIIYSQMALITMWCWSRGWWPFKRKLIYRLQPVYISLLNTCTWFLWYNLKISTISSLHPLSYTRLLGLWISFAMPPWTKSVLSYIQFNRPYAYGWLYTVYSRCITI